MRPERTSRLLRLSRRHFLRGAFSAICRLGSKSLKRAIHPAKPKAPGFEGPQPKKRRYVDEEFPIFEPVTSNDVLPQVHPDAELGVELDSIAIRPRSVVSPGVDGSFELPNTRSTLFEMDSVIPDSTVELSRAELASNRFSSASAGGLSAMEPKSVQSSPISPITSDHWFSSIDFDSPISPADVSNFLPWPESGELGPIFEENEMQAMFASTFEFQHNQEPDLPPQSIEVSRFNTGLTSRGQPNLSIDTSCANSRPIRNEQAQSAGSYLSSTPSPLQIEAQTQSPDKIVEELRGLFNTTYKLTYAKLSQPPVSPISATIFQRHSTPASVFELGWLSVAKVLRGELPQTLWEIFALAHLVYACALANQETNFLEELQDIYDDLVRWSRTIPSESERASFVHVVQQLFEPRSPGSNLPTRISPTASPDNMLSSRLFWQNLASSANHAIVEGNNALNERDLLTTLKEGIAFRLCVQYLHSKYCICLRWLVLTWGSV